MKYYMNYSGEERILEIKTLILFICDILLYTFKTCGQNFAAISQCLELRVNRVLAFGVSPFFFFFMKDDYISRLKTKARVNTRPGERPPNEISLKNIYNVHRRTIKKEKISI